MPGPPDPKWNPAPWCPPVIFERWRSRLLAGDAKHQLVVRIRKGHFERAYQHTTRLDTGITIDFPGAAGAVIWKGQNKNCWKANWVPTTDWITLPQIQSADYTTSFQNLGEVGGTGGSSSGQTSSVMTAVMDNVEFEPVTGPGGLYHTIKRGWFSPMRGAPMTARPKLWASNDWTNVLNGGYQIELWEGYGPDDDPSVIPLEEPIEQTIDGKTMMSCLPPDSAIARTWTGVIETCVMTADPDVITLTARDFGLTFTDQRCMGWNKAREIRAPTHFADRKQVLGQVAIGGPYIVSSGRQVDKGWVSGGTASPDDTEWIEIELPAGYYEDILWSPRYNNQEMWLSLKAGSGGVTFQTETHGNTHYDAGWVDFGNGDTPDGTPWLRHWPKVPKVARRWRIVTDTEPVGFKVSDGTKLRITLSKLSHDSGQPDGNTLYFTGEQRFLAYKFGTNPSASPGLEVNAKHWVLVEDPADVIRVVLIWCGFREWNVENFGWSLAHPKVYGEDKFFMDIINDMLAQGNFLFWMAPPTQDDRSLGVPIFRHQTATDNALPNMVEVRDSDLLESADITWDNSNLPRVIRVRGNINEKVGVTLDQDTQKRYMATYYPPWAGGDFFSIAEPSAFFDRPNRVHGINRQFTETLGMSSTIGLESDEECLFACLLVAIQYAIAMVQGQFQIAGLPKFQLNAQTSLVDEGSGANSRLWVASIESHHKMGEKGSWHMTIGGALIDTEDLMLIAKDYVWAWWLQHSNKTQSAENSGGFAPPSVGATGLA